MCEGFCPRKMPRVEVAAEARSRGLVTSPGIELELLLLWGSKRHSSKWFEIGGVRVD